MPRIQTFGTQLPANPSDGQIAQYNAAQNAWLAASPTGNAEIAYAENISGTATSGIGTTAVDLGVSIAIPASTRPVYLSASVTYVLTGTAGTGIFLGIVEVSNGVDTVVPTFYGVAPNPSTTSFTVNIVPRRIFASSLRTRTFKLQGLVGSGTGTVAAQNSSTYPTVLAAEAR